MDALVLGGTGFVGRHLVHALLAAGHRVTTFNRGVTAPGLFAEAEHLAGDRGGELEALFGRRWDVAFDTSGQVPAHVARSARVLEPAVERYVFVSTISVYSDPSRPLDERSPVWAPDFDGTERDDARYGPMKVACELAIRAVYGGRATIVRPGMLAGPFDVTDRFGWWVRRIERGGEVMAPGSPRRPVQVLDARDLAAFLMRLAEDGRGGTFNAVGPARPITLGRVLRAIRDAVHSDARFTWVSDEFLQRKGLEPWRYPLWLPRAHAAFFRVDASRARAAGLATRPLSRTARDFAAWVHAHEKVPPEREAAILRAWHRRRPPE